MSAGAEVFGKEMGGALDAASVCWHVGNILDMLEGRNAS